MTTAVALTDKLGSDAIENQVFVCVSYASQVFVDDVRLRKPPRASTKRSLISATGEWNLAVFMGSRSYTDRFASIMYVSLTALIEP